jgi:hypothetical protein
LIKGFIDAELTQLLRGSLIPQTSSSSSSHSGTKSQDADKSKKKAKVKQKPISEESVCPICQESMTVCS